MEKFSLERALSLESKYDDSLTTRPISEWLSKFVFSFSIIFALYHYITSGIGVPVDYWHMGAHMSGVLILIFISFPAFKRSQPSPLWDFLKIPHKVKVLTKNKYYHHVLLKLELNHGY